MSTLLTMHAPTAIDLRFWNRLAPRYAKQPVPDEAAYAQTLERVRAYLGPGDRVLEIGCGTGTTALELAAHAGSILATDASSGMIAIAEKKAHGAGTSNVRFTVATLDDTALEPEAFDVVMTFNLIHLLADVPTAIRRIRALVRPGGLFISKTPCIGERNALLRAAIPVMRAFGKAPFVNDVKQATLTAAIESAGFEILETGLYPAKSYSLFVVARSR